jgi:signal transduction histidine kinase
MSEPSLIPTRIPWNQSLMVRISILCIVLVLCLLAAVWFLATRSYQQVITHMESRADQISELVRIRFEERLESDEDPDFLTDDFQTIVDGIPVQIHLNPTDSDADSIRSHADEGGYYFSAEQYFQLSNGAKFEVQMELDFDPQTELVRAFKNSFLISISIVFILTLGVMIYLIYNALKPLRDLSDACAEIAHGDLKEVETTSNVGEIQALKTTFNGMVTSLRDKEKVEENLRQAQRLSAIGNLAAGVAHDVRNPLNAIKLISSHALDTLDKSPELAPTAKQVHTIRNEVGRLEEIVSNFLALAKEGELKREPLLIDSLLEECLQLIRKDAETRGVRVSSELRCTDQIMNLDPRQFNRAVLNVLINALETCPENGRIRLFSRKTASGVEIEIRDDGPGISKDIIDRVFDPYFTTKSTGTGLGLSITRSIIEEHNGTISITSSEDVGCQVLITLYTDLVT